MLTIFTVPKPFEGEAGMIQRNAIQSWLFACPGAQVILCGNESGVRDAASEFGLEHIPSIACNAYGTPLLDSVFGEVLKISRHSLMCYVNADILLLEDFCPAVRRIRFGKFLMIARRWDLEKIPGLDFQRVNWQSELRECLLKQGTLHHVFGCDCFVYSKGWLSSMPPFAVGRARWDNWVIYRARSLNVPVVDATRAVTIVHQPHGYAHVPEPGGGKWEGPETDENDRLTGGLKYQFYFHDATHVLTKRFLLPAMDDACLKRYAERADILGKQKRTFFDKSIIGMCSFWRKLRNGVTNAVAK
ncbi:MAG TPA: hypothetical protein PKL97_01465 [Candidatus Omnitrophota bacterium]|nr:hypothetical protein [Candidatus Omnitrophota bacterium]